MIIILKKKKTSKIYNKAEKKENSKSWNLFRIGFHLEASFEDLDTNLFGGTRATVKIFFQLALFLFQGEVKLQEKEKQIVAKDKGLAEPEEKLKLC